MIGYITWDVSPVIFSLLGRDIRWYGMCWAIGFMIGYWLMVRRFRDEKLPAEWVDKLLLYTLISSIVGARLGHCLFYEWEVYSAAPLRIFAIWEGGLASHGGVFCLIAGLFIYSRRVLKRSVWWLFDRMIPSIGIACALIRLGNLMNSEIFGFPTTKPWGFYFVRSHEWNELYAGQACHPTQIYEMMYCLAAVLVASLMLRRAACKVRTGLITGVSLIIFFGSRFALEFLKIPQVDREWQMTLDIGQWLSLPLIALGIYLIVNAMIRAKKV